jgi:hypothetical protein
MTTTGQVAFRMHSSATDPSTVCQTRLWPWLPSTSRSASRAASPSTSAARPSRTWLATGTPDGSMPISLASMSAARCGSSPM